jgi:hypothetical protein
MLAAAATEGLSTIETIAVAATVGATVAFAVALIVKRMLRRPR